MDAEVQPHVLSLTEAQCGLWLGQQLDASGVVYNTGEYVRLRGPVIDSALMQAGEQALAEAEVLHARVAMYGAELRQCLPVRPVAAVQRVDFSGQGDGEQRAQVYMAEVLQTPFDLAEGPLYHAALLRVSADCSIFFLCAHHIALDGFGFLLVLRRIAELYTVACVSEGRFCAAANKPRSPLGPLSPLSPVIAADKAYFQGPRRAADQAFWCERMASAPLPVALHGKGELSLQLPRRMSAPLATAAFAALRGAGRAARASYGEALIARVARLVACLTDSDEVVLGLPMMGRVGAANLRSPCTAMNLVPLRVPIERDPKDPAAAEVRCIAEVADALRELRPHARYRHERLRRDLGRAFGDGEVFGPVVNLMPFDRRFAFADLRASFHSLSAGPVVDWTVGMRTGRSSHELVLELDVNPDGYGAAAQAELWHALTTCLQTGVVPAAPSLHRRAAPSLHRRAAPSSQRRATLAFWSPAPAQPVRDVLCEVYAQVQMAPQRTALRGEDGHLTYRQLWDAVEATAHRLQAAGVDGGDLVGLCLPCGQAAIVGILACLRCGAAYLPLEVDGPQQRTMDILNEAQPVLVVHGPDLPEMLQAWPQACLLQASALDCLRELGTRQVVAGPPPEEVVQGPAYRIYTSGSTGRPNGVRIGRQALSHFSAAARERYGASAEDVWLQFATLAFDASVEEIFVALTSGGSLVLRDRAAVLDLSQLMAQCERHNVTVLDLPTALFHELVTALAAGRLALPSRVGTLIIGGEAVQAVQVERFLTRHPHVRLLNTYGPTEATVVSTCAELNCSYLSQGLDADSEVVAVPTDQSLPIGLPLPGTGVAVVDEAGRLAQEGELYLLGPQLADGYHDRPTHEQARFVRLSCVPDAPRAYRTGDRVRLGPDGQLQFVGRLDDELKISGYRVDPGEVENVLLCHPSVSQACVLVDRAHPRGQARLQAAWVAAFEAEPPPEVDRELRAHCSAQLIAAAVPQRFVRVARLPRNDSGKVDRRALLSLLAGQHAKGKAVAAAHWALGERAHLSVLQQRILAAYEEVLGRCDLPPDADFFDWGGQSLQAVALATALGAQLDREVPVAMLFRYPRADALAQALEAGPAAQDGLLAAAERMALLRRLHQDAVLPAHIARGSAPHSEDHTGDARPVLLTGATGFVGVHLLARLLRAAGTRVICLVRASDRQQARVRLMAALARHGAKAELHPQQVELLVGDLTQPRFGLEEAAFTMLAGRCGLILHCGALVSLARTYASVHAANVLGTRTVLELSALGGATPVMHVSTLAIAFAAAQPAGQTGSPAGAGGGSLWVREAPVPDPEALADGYSQSKWVAEQLLLEAHRRGFPVVVARLGRVVGPTSGEAVPEQDVFFRLLRAGLPRGVLPALSVSEPWTPVDVAADLLVEAATTLARLRGGAGSLAQSPVMHVAGGLTVWSQLYDHLSVLGYDFRRCSLSDFCERLRRDADREDLSTLTFLQGLHGRSDVGRGQGQPTVQTDLLRHYVPQAELRNRAVDLALFARYVRAAATAGWLPHAARAPERDAAGQRAKSL